MPRYTLFDEQDYTNQRSAVDENASEFFTDVPSLGFDNIPENAKDYVAPFIKPNVIPRRGVRYTSFASYLTTAHALSQLESKRSSRSSRSSRSAAGCDGGLWTSLSDRRG